MRRLVLAVMLALAAVALIPPATAAVIHGVTICGVNYNYGVSDGVCPLDYQAGSTGTVCDPDCIAPCTCTTGTGSCQVQTTTPTGEYYCTSSGNCQDCGPGMYFNGASCVSSGFTCGAATNGTTCAPAPISYQSAEYYCDAGNVCRDCGAGNIYRAGTCVPAACGASAGSPACAKGTAKTCATCSLDCGACAAPTANITATNTSALPQYTIVVTLSGTTDPTLGFTSLIIDNNSDGTFGGSDASSATSPLSVQISGLPAGNYTFKGQVTDSTGAKVVVTSNPVTVGNTPPSVSGWAPTTKQVYNGANTTFNFTASDDQTGLTISLNYGDGTVTSPPACPGTSCGYNLTHNYPTNATPYTATLTVTDSSGLKVTKTYVTDATGVSVEGTPTGNVTPDNSSLECASDSCAALKNGVWTCFSIATCYPDNATMCAGPGTPPTFINRDTSESACEAGGASTGFTCTAYVWANATWANFTTPVCCTEGNASRAIPTSSYGGQGCCDYPGMVFTTAGSNPGCYPGTENTIALCNDGQDNNGNGLIDAADPSCNAHYLNGTVALADGSGGFTAGIGVQVSIDSYKTTTYPCTINGTTLGCYNFTTGNLQEGMKTVIASENGYTVGYKTLLLQTNLDYSVNFTLSPRRCNADCSNDQGLCDTSCIGVGGCQPTPSEIATLYACQPTGAPFGLKDGTEIVIASNESNQSVETAVCCTVPGAWRPAPKTVVAQSPTFSGTIDTLVRYTSIVYIYGRPYKLVVNTW